MVLDSASEMDFADFADWTKGAGCVEPKNLTMGRSARLPVWIDSLPASTANRDLTLTQVCDYCCGPNLAPTVAPIGLTTLGRRFAT